MAGDKQYFDPLFEFDAPKGMGAGDENDTEADRWFGMLSSNQR